MIDVNGIFCYLAYSFCSLLFSDMCFQEFPSDRSLQIPLHNLQGSLLPFTLQTCLELSKTVPE